MLNLFLILSFLVVSFTISSPVLAEAKYSIRRMTVKVQAALNGRRDRFEQVRQLKQAGALGENNKGYLEVLNNEGNASSVAQAENNDRQVIYQTIAQQNELEGAMDTIESVFAQVQRDKAEAGDKIQEANGGWTTK